jgi:predicted DNA-binding protein
MDTRLTIKLPEDLHHRAKARAEREGTTLSRVVRERLEEFASGWDLIEEADDARAVDEIAARIARGEERLRDWAEVDAELDSLSGQGD